MHKYPQEPIDLVVLEEAADWLTRIGAEDVSPDDYQALERWRQQSPMHQAAWQRAELVMADFTQACHPIARQTIENLEQPERRQSLKALALLLVTAPVIGWMGYQTMPWREWQSDIRTAKGEMRTLDLEDGTQLILNTDTAVNIDYSVDARRITLIAGEVRITTGHIASTPFIVQTTEGQLKPLGTRFSVYHELGQTQVAVFDGRVEIRTTHAGAAVVLAGEQRRFNRDLIQSAQSTIEPTSLWEHGMLLAQGMPLGDLIEQLSRYRHGILRCDATVAMQSVSGAFPVTDSDLSLRLIEQSLAVQVRYITPWWVTVKAL